MAEFKTTIGGLPYNGGDAGEIDIIVQYEWVPPEHPPHDGRTGPPLEPYVPGHYEILGAKLADDSWHEYYGLPADYSLTEDEEDAILEQINNLEVQDERDDPRI